MQHELYTNYGMIFRRIVKHTCEYIDKNNIKTLVLGMSGGIDSTLCAALAYEVASEFSTGVELNGLILPIHSDKTEMERAVAAAGAFCNIFKLKDMSGSYYSLMRAIIGPDIGPADIRQGNIKARIRMIKLYDTAQKTNGMVLATDNYTEYLLGFWTLHGDVGDYGMIQNLWKTEVYGLANYLLDKYKKDNDLYKAIALLDGIKAMPTDGLGISESDFDQIYPNYNKNGTPVDIYGTIDAILLRYLNIDGSEDDNEIIRRHKATEFKRLNPFSIPRENLLG